MSIVDVLELESMDRDGVGYVIFLAVNVMCVKLIKINKSSNETNDNEGTTKESVVEDEKTQEKTAF